MRPIEEVGHFGMRRSGSVLSQAANLLSLSRFALAASWLAAFLSDNRSPGILASIALGAALTDILDGQLAQRTHSTRVLGRWLDSLADIAFVLTALSCEALAGAIPAYVPALIAVSFAQYAVDSLVISRSAVPIKSRLGHWGGIINYVLVILLALSSSAARPGSILIEISPLIALFYLAGIFERAITYRRTRAVRASAPH